MIVTPVRATVRAQEVAAIHLQIPVNAMRNEFPKAIEELLQTLQQQDIAPSGHVFAHHFRRPTESFDFQVCIPVKHPVQPAGRVLSVSMPDFTVMRTTYHGDYSGLPQAWGEFIASIQSQPTAMRGDFFEAYVITPHDSVAPEQWRTDLSVILNEEQGQNA